MAAWLPRTRGSRPSGARSTSQIPSFQLDGAALNLTAAAGRDGAAAAAVALASQDTQPPLPSRPWQSAAVPAEWSWLAPAWAWAGQRAKEGQSWSEAAASPSRSSSRRRAVERAATQPHSGSRPDSRAAEAVAEAERRRVSGTSGVDSRDAKRSASSRRAGAPPQRSASGSVARSPPPPPPPRATLPQRAQSLRRAAAELTRRLTVECYSSAATRAAEREAVAREREAELEECEWRREQVLRGATAMHHASDGR